MIATEMERSPEVHHPRQAVFWRAILLISLAGWGSVLFHLGRLALEGGLLSTSARWRMAAGVGLGIEAAVLALLLLTFTPLAGRLAGWLWVAFGMLQRLRFLNVLLFLACAALFAYILLNERGFLFTAPGARLGLLWTLAVPAGIFVRAALPGSRSFGAWAASFALALLGMMVVYRAAVFLPEVSAYPLSLGWSEASRYYYASLFFSESLYGQHLARPFLHPSRYMMQSLPYLIPQLPLLAHRLWQVLLWLGMTGIVALLLARRLSPAGELRRWLLAAWAFLFLFQGPVYYHLLVCVAIILAAFHPRRAWLSLAAVIAASLWAGISRINWFPVPAFLAVAIYLLEVPFSGARGWVDYLRRPVLWAAAGGISAFAAQAAYIFLSGNQDVKSFGSSFTSDLLWYRLWPSPTYPPGIFPMIVFLTLPVLLAVGWVTLRRGMHPLRLLGLGAMTLVLFAGGLVVSTKIGGGSNLHNMDAYLVLLMVWGSWLAFDRWTPDQNSAQPARSAAPLPAALLLAAALLPIYPLIQEGRPAVDRQTVYAWEDVREIQERVDEVTARGGQVLFISQRHLITFGMVQGVALEPAYETVELMEMAMSGNRDYLNQFYSDLRSHRFDLIVTGELNRIMKGPEDSFPEENNVWVERVSIPVLEYYESSHVMPHSRVQFLVPKP